MCVHDGTPSVVYGVWVALWWRDGSHSCRNCVDDVRVCGCSPRLAIVQRVCVYSACGNDSTLIRPVAPRGRHLPNKVLHGWGWASPSGSHPPHNAVCAACSALALNDRSVHKLDTPHKFFQASKNLVSDSDSQAGILIACQSNPEVRLRKLTVFYTESSDRDRV